LLCRPYSLLPILLGSMKDHILSFDVRINLPISKLIVLKEFWMYLEQKHDFLFGCNYKPALFPITANLYYTLVLTVNHWKNHFLSWGLMSQISDCINKIKLNILVLQKYFSLEVRVLYSQFYLLIPEKNYFDLKFRIWCQKSVSEGIVKNKVILISNKTTFSLGLPTTFPQLPSSYLQTPGKITFKVLDVMSET